MHAITFDGETLPGRWDTAGDAIMALAGLIRDEMRGSGVVYLAADPDPDEWACMAHVFARYDAEGRFDRPGLEFLGVLS